MKQAFVLGLMLLVWPMHAPASDACQKLTLHYHVRVPYAQKIGAEVRGLTADPAVAALQAAKLPFVWQETPPARQYKLITAGGGCDCGLGWFRLPERERQGKFSAALYVDRPQIALVRADQDAVVDGMTVEAALKLPGIKLLLKGSYSYGAWLDQKIAAARPQTETTLAGNTNMLRMLQAGRADMIFLAPEEADHAIASAALDRSAFKYVRLEGVDQGQSRHLFCSRRVSDDWLAAIDAALLQRRVD